MEIRVYTNRHISASLKVPANLLVRRLIEILSLKVQSLNVIFITDSELRALHKSYLNQDSITDVLTFNLNKNGAIEGEIYISAPRAAAQAKEYNVSLNQEICRLIVHGCLHLAGYSDQKKNDRTVMKHEEDKLTVSLYQILDSKK